MINGATWLSYKAIQSFSSSDIIIWRPQHCPIRQHQRYENGVPLILRFSQLFDVRWNYCRDTLCKCVFFVNVGDHWRMAQGNNHEWCIRNIQLCTKFHAETRWFLVPRASCVFQLFESGLTSSKVYRGHLGASCHGSARSCLLSTRGILNAFHAK